MHHADKTVTVYRKRWDQEKGLDVYKGTVFTNVSFFSRISAAVSTEGMASTCEGILRIPAQRLVEKLPETERPALKPGDLVCEGSLPVAGQTPADIDKQCPYVFTITGVTLNMTGKEPHVKAVCK